MLTGLYMVRGGAVSFFVTYIYNFPHFLPCMPCFRLEMNLKINKYKSIGFLRGANNSRKWSPDDGLEGGVQNHPPPVRGGG